MNQLDREADQLESDFSNGLISAEEYRDQIREMQREYRDMAEEAATDAYERELDNW